MLVLVFISNLYLCLGGAVYVLVVVMQFLNMFLFQRLRLSMFSKKKRKPIISAPSNFEHRVHTGYDKEEGKYVGLPPQWASIITPVTNRPKPIIDVSSITPTEILDIKHHVSGYRQARSVCCAGLVI